MKEPRNSGEAHAALEQTCCQYHSRDCAAGQGRSCPEPMWSELRDPLFIFLYLLAIAAGIFFSFWWPWGVALPIGE